MTAVAVRDLGPGVVGVTMDSPDGQTYVMNTPDRLAALVPTEVLVEVHPTATPAADLPLSMVLDVAKMLRAHGLDPDLPALSTALYAVITATSVEDGGTQHA